MSKFLKIINEQIPTGQPKTGSIPTGQGLKQQPIPKQPIAQQNKTSLGQIGGAFRKIGSGFEKVKGAVSATKQFVKTGDLTMIGKLGQQLINRALDTDTYKISVFGNRNYDNVVIVDKELLSKIELHGSTTSESVDILVNSGLLYTGRFLSILEQDQANTPSSNNPTFVFKLENERNLGTSGKQYTLVPNKPELEQYLNSKGIKFVTFLREPNTSPENIFGEFTFANNGGKLQFYDMNSQFIQALETQVRFEFSAKDKMYKIGSSLAQHSFADLEEAEKLLKKGIIIVTPNDRVFRPIGAVQNGKIATIRNIQTHEEFHGVARIAMSPDKKTSSYILTDVKPGRPRVQINTQQTSTNQQNP